MVQHILQAESLAGKKSTAVDTEIKSETQLSDPERITISLWD